jgi:hypothetical protein
LLLRAAGVCAGLSLLPLLPGIASAQETDQHIVTPYRWIDRSLRVGPYAGYLFATRGDSKLGAGPGAMFGGRLRVRLSSPLSFELNAAYGTADRYVLGDPRQIEAVAIVDTVPVNRLFLQGSLQLSLTGARSWHRLQPYLLIGGGVLQGISEKRSDKVTEQFDYQIGTNAALAAGLGVEWDVSDRIGIGLELRDHIWKIKTPDAFFLPTVLEKIRELDAKAPTDSQWTNNPELSVSAWWYF